MKKLILSLIVLLHAVAANAEIKFLVNPDWATVLKKAKDEKKLIFLDAFATWCGPCKQMDKDVYTDSNVAEYYNANFINVKYDMEQGEGLKLAAMYNVTAYPSLYYVDGDGKVVHKSVGYKVPDQFLLLGKQAIDPSLIPEDPYVKLKEKASTLSPADFLEFSAMAQEREDEDYEDIVKAFVLNQPDMLASEALITILMEHVVILPDLKKVEYLLANKAKITSTGLYQEEEIEEKLSSLAIGYAVYANTNEDGEADLDAIKIMLDKLIPKEAFFHFNYYKIGYSLDTEDTEEAFNSFKNILNAPADQVSFEKACQVFLRYGAEMNASGNLDKLFELLDNYKIPAEEENKAYFKDLAKAVVYANLRDKEKFRTYAEKLIANNNVPEEIKTSFTGILEKLKQQQ